MWFQGLKLLKMVVLMYMSHLQTGTGKQQNPFDPNMMAFTSPEDLMKNLPKAIANVSKAMSGDVLLLLHLQRL
jgi:hypothetical protein